MRCVHRGGRGRRSHRVAERTRSAQPDEGNARHPPAARILAHRAARAALQPHALHPHLPVVGQRRGDGARAIPIILPAGCPLRGGPRGARDVVVSRGAKPLLRRGLPQPPRRERPFMVCKYPGAHELHDLPDGVRLLRRIRLPRRRRIRACGGPAHRPRQKAVDLGKPRLRSCMGSRTDRCQRPLHRVDGRSLHRQPAGLHLSRAV